MKLLVVGESCTDIYHYGDCPRLCPDAPVPIFKSSKNKITNGGMAHNVYNNLISLGTDVDIHTNKNWRSISKIRLVDRRSNYTVLRMDNNDNKYGKCKIKDIDFSNYSAVIISDYNSHGCEGYL